MYYTVIKYDGHLRARAKCALLFSTFRFGRPLMFRPSGPHQCSDDARMEHIYIYIYIYIRCSEVKKEALACCNSEFHALWRSSDRLFFFYNEEISLALYTVYLC